MKAIVFDTGPLISFALNNILDLFSQLKNHYKGAFLITPSVKKEAVDNPLNSKKFKFEALQLLEQIQNRVINIYEYKEMQTDCSELINLANNIFSAHGNYIKVVHKAEIEALALVLKIQADAFVIDEFVTRSIIENPYNVEKRLQRKLHTKISVNKENLNAFSKIVKNVTVLRSVELITIAYELGLLNQYKILKKDPDKNLLEAVLWGAKLNGCSISLNEIHEIMKLEGF
jgi:predicted nucleic acid-binding protein